MAIRVLNTRNKLLQSQGKRQNSQRCLIAQEMERLDAVHTGDTIQCTNGVLWITQAGDPQDYL